TRAAGAPGPRRWRWQCRRARRGPRKRRRWWRRACPSRRRPTPPGPVSPPSCPGTFFPAAAPAMPGRPRDRLERQQLVTQGFVVPQAGGGAAEADGAFLQHVDAVGQGQQELGVLLGKQDGQTLVLEPGDL